MFSKAALKRILGELPLTAELYWSLRQSGKPIRKNFSLQKLNNRLPELRAQAEAGAKSAQQTARSHPAKRILVFATLRYWIEHAALLSLALAGQGHQVTLVYLPYANWRRPINRFDLRRQNIYARSVFRKMQPFVRAVSLLDVKPIARFPSALLGEIDAVSVRDTQYTLQVEDVDRSGSQSESAHLYRMRLERNLFAAGTVLAILQSLPPAERPEVLLTPNGSIMEMGAVYQAARHLQIPTVTYEFGEQRGRIWLAQDSEVMRQDTTQLWQAHKDQSLSEDQREQVHDLYASRQNASLWKNFSRLWQGQPTQGGEKLRTSLNLDDRPIVLLAANVIGDSLTLGRQVFSQNMTDWLIHSVKYFSDRDDVQFIVRIHPGEKYTNGPSVAQVVKEALPQLPEHFRLVEAQDPINTYDLIELADLGMVYTTTAGMEMAMSGLPVIVAGQTHYRGKGFTLDPDSWSSHQEILEKALSAPDKQRLSREQVEGAWKYAYHFFFDYPCSFPWHLMDFWSELETWSLERVLSAEGQALFGSTLHYLAGEPRQWSLEGHD